MSHVTKKGWYRALPRVRFHIVNSVNKSTGYSGFQLRMGRSPRIIPPIVTNATTKLSEEEISAAEIICQLEIDITEAQDNLLAAKFTQAEQSNKDRGPDPGQHVKLSTTNRRGQYVHAGDKNELRVAKFMPRFDGPYDIIGIHPECSTITLDMSAQPGVYPTFHTSEIEPYIENDPDLFPNRELPQPGPMISGDSCNEEWEIADIIDKRKRSRSMQYLVRWAGHGTDTW
jgi:hypothetical protein